MQRLALAEVVRSRIAAAPSAVARGHKTHSAARAASPSPPGGAGGGGSSNQRDGSAFPPAGKADRSAFASPA